jgi:2-polyprenyl-6-methoxyphenol hydroxylase-like FAD-dependent oxidoreductase
MGVPGGQMTQTEGMQILRPDILIVGAGVAGSTLALTLNRRGFQTLLVERAPAPKKIFKGEYLQPAVVRFFENLKIDDIFKAESVSSVRELRFRDLDADGKVVSDLLMTYPNGASARSISHFDLLNGLMRHTQAELGDNLWVGATLTPLNPDASDFLSAPEFSLQSPKRGKVQVYPKWVVGCDGRGSSVRRWMGVDKTPKNAAVTLGTGKEFIMGLELNAPAPKADRYEVIRTFERGTLSAFSLKNHGQRVYFSSPEIENINKVVAQEIREIISDIRPIIDLGEVDESAPVMGCPANTSWYSSPSRGHFLLAGDAIAVTTPYGGQGMTAACENVDYLASQFNWHAGNRLTHALSQIGYSRAVRKTYERINILNLGLYYMFFSRQSLWKLPTQYLTGAWQRNDELSSRVMRLFGGIDTDKPTLRELLDLQGFAGAGRALGTAPAILRRSAGELLASRVSIL